MKLNYKSSVFIGIGAVITGVLVYLAGSKYGPGLTFDSVNYLYAGHSLLTQGTFLRPSGATFIEWPPLYPTLIAGIGAMEKNLLQGVFYFQIAIAGITVWIAGELAKQYSLLKGVFAASFLAIIFSPPVILINHFVWSEGFFVFLSLIFIYLLVEHIQRPTSATWWSITLAVSLLCLQRHVGAFFVAASVLLVWHYSRHYSVIKTMLSGIFHGLLALLPITLWWFRNYLAQGLIMTDYRSALFETPFLSHWLAFNNIFTSWFLPDELHIWLRVFLVYLLIIWLAFMYFQQVNTTSKKHYLIVVMATLFCFYFMFTFIASFAVGEPLDDRILAPVYIPGMLLFFLLLENYIQLFDDKIKKWIIYGLLLWSLYPISRSIANVYRWQQQQTSPFSSQPVKPEDEYLFKF